MKHNIIIDASVGKFSVGENSLWPGCDLVVIAKEFNDEELAVVEDIMKSAAVLIEARLNELNPEVVK